MPYNLFLFPIITGYLVLAFSLIFKYNVQRLSRNRILFESITVGLLIVIIGFLARTLIEAISPAFIETLLSWLAVVPIEKPKYFWTVLFSCFFTVVVLFICNQIIRKKFDRDLPIVWAIQQNGDEIEKLFKDSAEHGFAMQLTLKNNKVYIGFSETIPIPQKTNYLTITPILSGYRESESKKLIITTDYFKVVEDFINDIEEKEGVALDEISLNTDIIIKQDEILTASAFDQEVFDKFNAPSL